MVGQGVHNRDFCLGLVVLGLEAGVDELVSARQMVEEKVSERVWSMEVVEAGERKRSLENILVPPSYLGSV